MRQIKAVIGGPIEISPQAADLAYETLRGITEKEGEGERRREEGE